MSMSPDAECTVASNLVLAHATLAKGGIASTEQTYAKIANWYRHYLSQVRSGRIMQAGALPDE